MASLTTWPRSAAERPPDAELAPAARDGVAHDARDAEGRQQQRDTGEDAADPRAEPLAPRLGLEHVGERDGVVDGRLAVEAPDGRAVAGHAGRASPAVRTTSVIGDRVADSIGRCASGR